MFPHPMLRSDPANNPDPPPAPDLTGVLDQHLSRGFPRDLALDLVLNELVLRAADATHASAAALALVRGDEMVCRAATGLHAPDLGIPINLRDGLSGACVRTREPQLSNDTEADPRVDSAIARRLGIRSMLLVPVFEGESVEGGAQELTGVLEVFSPLANAFDEHSQKQLEEFARECARVRQAADKLPDRPIPEVITPDVQLTGQDVISDAAPPMARRPTQPFEGWTIALAAMVIIAAIGVSFLIGSRVGWLRATGPSQAGSPETPDTALPAAPPNANAAPQKTASPASKAVNKTTTKSGNATSSASSDELVVYDKGKVIFRMKPAPRSAGGGPAPERVPAHDMSSNPQVAADRAAPETASSVISAASNTRVPAHAVWLAPAQAERRILSRTEPQYPPDALAARRSGNVVLEVQVAEDGSVSSVRTLSGDPALANAAAEAVRNWRYQPYLSHEQPSPFQTDVTLTFSLPN